MKKKEIVWLAIRLFGLYFAYDAVVSLINLLSNLLLIVQTPEIFSKSMLVVFQQLVLLIIKAVAAFYFLRDGTLFFDVLNREEPVNRTENDLDEISIK